MLRRNGQPGQAMALTAVALIGITAIGLLLIVNALTWFNSYQATFQAVWRAAQDGAGELAWENSLPLEAITDPEHPDLPTATPLQCLNLDRARAVTLASLQQNLEWSSTLYVTVDGEDLSPAQVISDTAGIYLLDLSIVNPTGLGCAETDPIPTYPAGGTYPYQRPYVHMAVSLPMKAMFGFGGQALVSPRYVVDVTSAIDPAGGAISTGGSN